MFERKHKRPEGCHGVARESHTNSEASKIKVETVFTCPGLEGVQKLNPTEYEFWLPLFARRDHTKETEAYIAAACGGCKLSPAARLFEDRQLREATTAELEHRIREAELENRRLELENEQLALRLRLGEQATAAETQTPPDTPLPFEP